MKILQIIQKPQKRGAETFACQLANHLVQHGHDVRVLAIFDGAAELPFNNIETLGGSLSKRFLDISAWKRLSSYIRKYKPDIVQANAGDTLKYAVFSKLLFGWKSPIVYRNASEVGRYLKNPLQKSLNHFFYTHTDRVVSVSQASERNIHQHFPFLRKKSTVIPIGLEESEKFKDLNFTPGEAKHIVHVGGFTFEKNHEGLLRIFQLILDQGLNVQLHLVGDGPLKSKIHKIVQDQQLSSRVNFYGFVNNPLSFIKSGDVLVLPSIIEGLPGVLLESMYCKTPVVAYDIGGISEIVNSETGKLVPENDEKGFADAIINVIHKPSEQQIENAHRMVQKNFMNREIVKDFISVYRKTKNL